jgi:hypothetical protein
VPSTRSPAPDFTHHVWLAVVGLAPDELLIIGLRHPDFLAVAGAAPCSTRPTCTPLGPWSATCSRGRFLAGSSTRLWASRKSMPKELDMLGAVG